MSIEPIISVKNLTMHFGETIALDNLSTDFYPGRIYVVVGENGAGKSTLMKIISGFLYPTSGDIYVEGKKESLNPRKAKELGIVLVPQELNLVDTLKVYENIFLGDEIRNGILLNKKKMILESQKVINEFGADIDANSFVGDLPTGKKQMIEIIKAVFVSKARVIILDEPTASLSEDETQKLFKTIRKLKEKGVTVIFVSHRLKEVIEIGEQILILRDGKKVYQGDLNGLTESKIAEMMVGRELSQIYPSKPQREQEIILEVRDLTTLDGKVRNVSFKLFKGEILGFYGLVGSGRTELMEAIIGLRKLKSGTILLNGKELKIQSVRSALRSGILYLPEERKYAGLITSFEAFKNVSILVLERIHNILTSKNTEIGIFEKYRKKFDIKVASPYQITGTLSGGNQQKLVVSKLVEAGGKIFIFDEPTRGVDVGSRHQIYKIISELVHNYDVSFIVISSDLPEIIGLCNRVIVMRNGEVVGEADSEELTEYNLAHMALGVTKASTIGE